MRQGHAGSVARDVFIRLDRCQYCNRPGFLMWDTDLFTCGREICQTLAFTEVRRRHRIGHRPVPEKDLARALLEAFDTFDRALGLDECAEVVSAKEAAAIRERERSGTAHVLAEVKALARRYPRPARSPLPRPRRVSRGTARAARASRRSATPVG
jgi:hypothetical protein